jgi:D-alanine-D-alanine ligase
MAEPLNQRAEPVVVLAGGESSEREVSLASGKQVYLALMNQGYQVHLLDLDKDVWEKLKELKPGVVFIALHGSPGEDGKVQALLEVLGIPYTGSGVLASALAMNKLYSKRLFSQAGLPVLPYEVVERSDWPKRLLKVEEKVESWGGKCVVKPVAEGSSVGVTIVKSKLQLQSAFEKAFKFGQAALVEKYFKAREIQVGILGNKKLMSLPPIEIVAKKEFFDYEAKYTPGLADEITPAPLSDTETKEAQSLAAKAFRCLGCRGFARVDMFYGSSKFYISEVNTIPGLTANSLFPKEAQAAGISFSELVVRIVNLALEED